MSISPQMDTQLEQIGKASRRSALVSLLGFLLTLAAIGYAVIQLHRIEKQRADLLTEEGTLRSQLATTQAQLNLAHRQITDALQEVTAARDTKVAIDAFHAGHWTEAVSLYDKALASDPDNAYLQDLRAYTLFKLGKIDQAIAGERLAIAADPTYFLSYFNLARAQCAVSPPQMEEAKKSAAEAVRLNPQVAQFIKQDGEFQRVCKGQIQ
jgi:tetratricopeptide (TPR) repeat protein